MQARWRPFAENLSLLSCRQILLFAEVLTCVGVVVSFDYFMLPFTVPQYVAGALLIFVSAEVLEGMY